MQTEKDLFDLIKEVYPQKPREKFVTSTEKILRNEARRMKRKRMARRLTYISSSMILCAAVFSWFFYYGGKAIITDHVFHSVGQESIPPVVKETNPAVYIYHSHNTESFIPELKGISSPDMAYHDKKNISLVGERLSDTLKAKSIDVIHNQTDVADIISKKGLSFRDSYKVSRKALEESLKTNKDIHMVFDIHRDAQNRQDTTIKINGKDYARLTFVVSEISDNFEANQHFAKQLHEKLEVLYPGLSRGIVFAKVDNQTYNQDLIDQSVILEIGGVENTLEEAYQSAEAFAEVVKEIIEEH